MTRKNLENQEDCKAEQNQLHSLPNQAYKEMFQGILFALAASFIWAFIYVVPQFITGFSSLEVALGRYLVYGVLSLFLFLYAKATRSCSFPWKIWIKALYFSLICTIGYYTFVVLALRYSSASLCALILGISPITISLYGNWRQKEIAFKKLMIPSLLILIGLAILSFAKWEGTSTTSQLLGWTYSLLALAAWTWYVEANSRFLKEYPEVPSSDWCTLIGIGTLGWVILFALSLILFFPEQIHFEKYGIFNDEWKAFLIGSIILGVFCSWVAEYLWNLASLLLPVSIAGQISIFETAFALLLVFCIDWKLPASFEAIGIGIQLLGIFYGVRQFASPKTIQKTNQPNI